MRRVTVAVACLGQSEQSSVLGFVVETQRPHPSSLGIPGLQEPGLGFQVGDKSCQLGM